MKKIVFPILLAGLVLLCTACGSKSAAPATLSPEEELLNSYNSVCSDLSYEQDYLAELISEADEKLKNTSEKDVADTAVLESLSKILLEAMDYKNYSIKTFELGDDKIQSEMTEVEEAYDALSKIVNNLEGATSAVEESIQEKIRIEEEKKASLIWPGKAYTWEVKDGNGYVVEVTVKMGSWIKASDTDSLNKAWKKAGGEGDAPDASEFNSGEWANYDFFRNDSSVMTFATLELSNKTTGYDFTEEYPYEIWISNFTNLSFPKDSKLGTWQGKIYFGSGPSDMQRGNGSISSAVMKKNHWGPVTIAFAVANVFGPNYDTNGNPDLDDVAFGLGGNSVKIPSIWKTVEPISLYESDYSEKNWLASANGRIDLWFVNGAVTENGWEPQEDGEKNLVLIYRRYLYGSKITNAGNSDITTNLSKLYSSFEGDIVVVSDCRDNSNSVKIKIYGDDTLLWESDNITGNSADIHFNVNVSDIQTLKIESVTDENNPGPSVAIINDVIS